MEATKNNALIAKHMNSVEVLDYHTEWKHLLPVIERINHDRFVYNFIKKGTTAPTRDSYSLREAININIKETYLRVVDYVNAYNLLMK